MQDHLWVPPLMPWLSTSTAWCTVSKRLLRASAEAISSAAGQDTIIGWDSVAPITLVNPLGEEFAIEIDFEDSAGVMSFAGMLQLVHSRRQA